jgi:3-dehydroquinate synthetase
MVPQLSNQQGSGMIGQHMEDHFDRLIKAKCENKCYNIYISDLCQDSHFNHLKDYIGTTRAMIVTTPTVASLYANDIFARLKKCNRFISLLVLECTEDTKTFEQIIRVCESAVQNDIDRQGFLIGIGGGVCLDIVTCAASLIRRGIAHIRIPTTLVAQIDAGIGIKGAINFLHKKSYLGCFYPPAAVFADPRLLSTLPLERMSEGFAEIIKIAIVKDSILFLALETHGKDILANLLNINECNGHDIIWHSIIGMLEELEQNFFENKTYKRLVDFGHTFSPVLESSLDFKFAHGQAVAIDMAVSTVLAMSMRRISERNADRILDLILAFGLPIWHSCVTIELCTKALLECSLHRGNSPNLVIPTGIGAATFLADTTIICEHLKFVHTFLKEKANFTDIVKPFFHSDR